MPEFYAGEQLRWAFGFDNPNKAAALFVSLIPFVVWLSFRRPKNKVLQIAAIILGVSGISLLCVGLVLTHSRGGIAALIGMALFCAFKFRCWLLKRPWLCAVALIVLVATALPASFSRSVSLSDRSIGNRLQLWTGALQMAARIPLGVGPGNSGRVYMDWFQPIQNTAGYRTMVNSYLTLLVEHGFPIFLFAMFAGSLVALLLPSRVAALPFAAEASLLGTAIAGFFSTTLEDFRLWIVPAFALLMLSRRPCFQRFAWKIGVALAAASGIGAAIYAVGAALPVEPEVIFRTPESVNLRPAKSTHVISFYPDEEVLGKDCGKLIRQSAMALDSEIRVNQPSGPILVLVTGDRIYELLKVKSATTIALAPARLDPQELEELLTNHEKLLILGPGIDEDGRVRFWRKIAAANPERIEFIRCEKAVGTNLASEWRWVLDAILPYLERR